MSPDENQCILENLSPSSHGFTGSFIPANNGEAGLTGQRETMEIIGAESGKRKRGRPRKYEFGVKGSEDTPKRGPGRPKGSFKSKLAGGISNITIGKGFTPIVEIVQIGEDVVPKISSLCQKGPRAICILSATGCVSTVTICQADASCGALTYEGLFEILSLSGSYSSATTDGVHHKIGVLTVSLAKSDGQVFGGTLAGSMIAGSPIQLIVGRFKQCRKNPRQPRKFAESSMAAVGNSELDLGPTRKITDGESEENCGTSTSELSEQNKGAGDDIIITDPKKNNGSLQSVCWNESKPMSEQWNSPELNAGN